MLRAWPKEDEKKLEYYWNTLDLSASKISKLFEGKYSRNSVIGKAKRMTLKERQSPIIRSKKWREVEIKPVKDINEPLVATYAEIPKNGCQWPYSGNTFKDTIGWCGRESHGKYPYCIDHCKKSYPKFVEVDQLESSHSL